MKFIRVKVKDHVIVHGFDDQNAEIEQVVEAKEFTDKLINVDRVLSVSEKFILTSYAYGRIIFWEYEGSLDKIEKLISNAH